MLERIKESITKKSYCSKCDELVGYYVVLETRKIKFGEIAFEATLKMAYCKHCRNKVSVHKIKKYNDKVINDTYKKICNNGKKLTKTEKIILKGIKIVYEN